MKIYLSGPMKGYAEHNFPLFNAVTQQLRNLGYEVVNPAEINSGPAPDEHGDRAVWDEFYNQCLRRDIKALCDCDVIVMLSGWEMSVGANLELNIAHRVGIRPWMYNDFLKMHYAGEIK